MVRREMFDSAATAASVSRLRTARRCGVLGLDIARLADFAADREPSIAFALLVQHVAETEQPWRAAGIDQRAMEDAVAHHPFLVVTRRLIRIVVGHGAQRVEALLHRR